MATSKPPEHLRAIAAQHDVTPDALQAAVNEEFARRAAERKQRREERLAERAPGPNDRYHAIRSGAYKPQRKPRSSPDDRQYVAGALRKWRRVHGLSQRQAQLRIGLSASAQTWHMYETGISCPPYRTLLKIIAATGLGHEDPDALRRRADLELDMLATDTRERLAAQRRDRRERRDELDAAAIRE